MDVLAALEGSGVSMWVLQSNSIWGYPTILTLHTVGLALLVGANAVIDLRILGVGGQVPLEHLARAFRVMWIGFWLNAMSGGLLFMTVATSKGTTRLFLGKLALVAIGESVVVVIRRQVFATSAEPQIGLAAKALACASLAVWIAAIAAGRLMAYI
jgi:hypothetical protein